MLEHCCDPLIRGSDAGGVRGEDRWFSVWLSLLTAGTNGGECSMEGDGLRAERETMDRRRANAIRYGSGVDLELYVISDFASRDTNRRSVSGGVMMCSGACVSFYFIFRTQKSVTLSSSEAGYAPLAAGIKETICFTVYLEFYLPGPRRWMHFSQRG